MQYPRTAPRSLAHPLGRTLDTIRDGIIRAATGKRCIEVVPGSWNVLGTMVPGTNCTRFRRIPHRDLDTLSVKTGAETLELYLTEEGYDVVTAHTGTEGLNRYVKSSPEVVILDIRLPDIDGFTVLEDLREENENVKVIMITAHHDMDSTIKAMKGGAFDYIHKPINIDELDIAVKKAVKTYEMEKKIDGLLMEPSRQFKVGDIIGTGREIE